MRSVTESPKICNFFIILFNIGQNNPALNRDVDIDTVRVSSRKSCTARRCLELTFSTLFAQVPIHI
jgi:hypothetical protein